MYIEESCNHDCGKICFKQLYTYGGQKQYIQSQTKTQTPNHSFHIPKDIRHIVVNNHASISY